MGAEYLERTIKGGNETYVKRKFIEMQEQAEYEHGNSYSGDWNMASGIKFTNKKFKSRDEASKYMINTVQKWEEALVCEYRNDKGQLVWLIAALVSS